jgi:hypothetical protein
LYLFNYYQYNNILSFFSPLSWMPCFSTWYQSNMVSTLNNFSAAFSRENILFSSSFSRFFSCMFFPLCSWFVRSLLVFRSVSQSHMILLHHFLCSIHISQFVISSRFCLRLFPQFLGFQINFDFVLFIFLIPISRVQIMFLISCYSNYNSRSICDYVFIVIHVFPQILGFAISIPIASQFIESFQFMILWFLLVFFLCSIQFFIRFIYHFYSIPVFVLDFIS